MVRLFKKAGSETIASIILWKGWKLGYLLAGVSNLGRDLSRVCFLKELIGTDGPFLTGFVRLLQLELFLGVDSPYLQFYFSENLLLCVLFGLDRQSKSEAFLEWAFLKDHTAHSDALHRNRCN